MQNENIINVLLVDDEEDFLAPTSRALSKRGMRVDTAMNGCEALAKLEEYAFDVIVLDIKMPEMDGIETLKVVRSYWPHIQIIMLTGHGSIESAFQTSREGAFEFLTKPCDIDELAEKINLAHQKAREDKSRDTALKTSRQLGAIRLLLVDDEKEFLESTEKMLNQRGMKVSLAENGISAISLLDRQAFDVIVLDYKLPDMDGIELLKVIKIRWPETAVILLTGHATLTSAKEGLQHGAFAYLTKPHDINELLGMIMAANQKKTERDKQQIADLIDDFIRRIPGKKIE